jgi:hypothetical protein
MSNHSRSFLSLVGKQVACFGPNHVPNFGASCAASIHVSHNRTPRLEVLHYNVVVTKSAFPHVCIQVSCDGPFSKWSRQDRRGRPGPLALASPFAFAQGAAANVPQISTTTPPRSHHTPDKLAIRRQTPTPAAICRPSLRNYVPRSPLKLQDVFCTIAQHQTPSIYLSSGTRCSGFVAHARTTPLTPLLIHVQTLKTRRKKNVKKGIQFCLMVCGASGTGRTTFVNTLCGKQVLEHKESDDPTVAHIEEGVKIQPITVGTWLYQLLWN